MAEIRLLDSNTIDKIAAGEVVERPSSVVKELVENAMDSGADAVTVEIRDGGCSFIRVTDNGGGIEKDQVRKAFFRHATSKISSAEDLFHIRSLGFRGEALSSISAVSMVELITKTKEQLTGVHYCLEGDKEKEFSEVGAPDGTTIIVRELFFNTPVRKKFLKSPVTEGSYISDLMEHMALSRPDVAFQFMVNGNVKFHTSGNGDIREIIYRIYGREVVRELIPFKASGEGLSLEGYLGSPSIVRSNRNFEFFFVNGRYIRSPLLSKGLEAGYKAYLMQHKFPFALLHVKVEPENVDVNVHPSKMEVRFHDQPGIYAFLEEQVRRALRQREMIPDVALEEKRKVPPAGKKTAAAADVRTPLAAASTAAQGIGRHTAPPVSAAGAAMTSADGRTAAAARQATGAASVSTGDQIAAAQPVSGDAVSTDSQAAIAQVASGAPMASRDGQAMADQSVSQAAAVLTDNQAVAVQAESGAPVVSRDRQAMADQSASQTAAVSTDSQAAIAQAASGAPVASRDGLTMADQSASQAAVVSTDSQAAAGQAESDASVASRDGQTASAVQPESEAPAAQDNGQPAAASGKAPAALEVPSAPEVLSAPESLPVPGEPAPTEEPSAPAPKPRQEAPQPFETNRRNQLLQEEAGAYTIENPQQMELFDGKLLSKEAARSYHILGQVFDTYWLVEYEDKLMFLDQHAAHEKVKYEALVEKIRTGSVDSQMLTPPMVMNLSAREAHTLKEYQSYFEKLGFEIEDFGGNAVAVRAVPCDLFGHYEKDFLQSILDELEEEPPHRTPAIIEEKLASMACKSAVKGNNRMSERELEELLDQLLKLENPYHCPHGRPTIITMSKYELEKKFRRIV